MSSGFPKHRGFTLIELMVVVAVIALLSSIVLAALSSAKRKADEASVLSAMHQLQNAIEIYRLSTNNYPGAISGSPFSSSLGINGGFGPGFYADSLTNTYSVSTCPTTADDFHCILNYFLVNGTTKFIPSIFSLPSSFDPINDIIAYYIPSNTHTYYCNGIVEKNYIISVRASDHSSIISNMQQKIDNTPTNNVGCIGG